MSALFAELGKKLAEKWLSLLVLPGLLFIGTASIAAILGQAEWSNVTRLLSVSTLRVATVQAHGAAAILLVAVAVLLASAGAGLLATGTGRVVRLCWLGRWPPWAGRLHRVLANRRASRWDQAQQDYEDELARGAGDQFTLDRLAHLRNRIALVRPQSPTWIGDRVIAVDVRVFTTYRLDLASAWPRLWLTVPDAVRAELRAAEAAFEAAATMAGWSLLYLLVGVAWWPATVVGLLASATSWRRGRYTATSLTELAEATVDLHGHDLATALGLGVSRIELTPELGQEITSRLRKGS